MHSKKTLVRRALMLALIVVWMSGPMEAVGDFSAWWARFQAAVAAHDAQSVARGAKFPMNWENGPVRQIKTESDFTSRFTPCISPRREMHMH